MPREWGRAYQTLRFILDVLKTGECRNDNKYHIFLMRCCFVVESTMLYGGGSGWLALARRKRASSHVNRNLER